MHFCFSKLSMAKQTKACIHIHVKSPSLGGRLLLFEAGCKWRDAQRAMRNFSPLQIYRLYTIGLTETSALVCLRSAEYRATTGNRILTENGGIWFLPPRIGGGGGRALFPNTLMCGGKSTAPPPYLPHHYPIAC